MNSILRLYCPGLIFLISKWPLFPVTPPVSIELSFWLIIDIEAYSMGFWVNESSTIPDINPPDIDLFPRPPWSCCANNPFIKINDIYI